jgi:hypothetical protein
MIRIAAVLLAAAAPAAAQVAPLSYDSGKALPITPGAWSLVATATGSEASYGAHISLRCDRAARTVTIARPAAPAASLTIVTDSLTRALPAGGRLLANDPLLDAIAFSRGRFLVSGGSGPVLAVPTWPEAARAIEDCRN